MTENRPITFIWNDAEQVMKPFGYGMSQKASDRYGDGEIVRLIEVEERSTAAHNHYFATLADLFSSLPENMRRDEEWAESVEHMRKWALIKTGFRDVTDYACETKAEAKRWAARLQTKDDYSIVLVEGTVVRVLTAKSQSHKAMPTKGEFQRSKEAVLNYLSDLIGLPPEAEQRKAQ